MKGMQDDILTIDELCIWLKFKKSFIYDLTRSNRIPFIKIGRHLRFRRSDIIDWLDEQAQEPVEIAEFIFD